MAKNRKAKTAAAVDLSRFQGGRWDLPRCFIIHAWSPDYIKHVISEIRAALSKNFHVDVDLDFGSGESLRQQALDAIQDAALVICILDDLRPNVVFEWGYAKALQKPTIPMACKGAVVNVRDYYPENEREGITNPPLDVDKHFSDVKDLLHCRYDSGDPDAPKALIADELKNRVAGKSLARRVLETWVQVFRSRMGREGDFEPLFEYILKTDTINLDKPLFATRRRAKFAELFGPAVAAGAKRAVRAKPPKALDDALLEAIADLPPEECLDLVGAALTDREDDVRLRFVQCYAAAMVAEDAEYKDAEANKQAVGLHERFLAHWPGKAEAHNNYANLLKELKRFDEAEDHYKAALKATPDHAAAHYNYANLLKELKRFDEAETQYKAALKARPQDAATHNNYANLLKELKRFHEAEKHYKAALKARPDYAKAHNNYANLLDELKRLDEAEEHYKAALKARPDLAEAWANLAWLYQGTRRPEEARRCYRRALDLGTLPDGGELVRRWLSELDAPGASDDGTPPNA